MQLLRSLSGYVKDPKGLSLAIGNFDGVHLGHQAVIRRMQEKARALGLKSAVMLFEPHPREFFCKDHPPARLSSLEDKCFLLEKLGVEQVLCMGFDEAFASQSPGELVKDLLVSKLGVREVTVGSLFNFAKGGCGDIKLMQEIGAPLGLCCEAIAGVTLDGVRISSTLIRELLKKGDVQGAQRALGHPFSIGGIVEHGKALGRSLGFPTANLSLKRQVCPVSGVFAVKVQTPCGLYGGMCNAGLRPTAESSRKEPLLEASLFHFTGSLYGKGIRVYFIEKIREERRFPDLRQLTLQLRQDQDRALGILKDHPGDEGII